MSAESKIAKSLKFPEKKIFVLKKQYIELEISELVEKKKTSVFGSALRRPSPENIHADSLITSYEPYLIISAQYEIDFFRKNTFTLNVEEDVKELRLRNEIFPIKTESGVLGKVGKKMKEGVGMRKNQVEIDMEEHAFRKFSGTSIFDSHGIEQKEFQYNYDSKLVESSPLRVLEERKESVKSIEIDDKKAALSLYEKLRNSVEGEIRVNSEEFTIEKIEQIYVPIFEARLIDAKNKIEIMRIDGISKKIL